MRRAARVRCEIRRRRSRYAAQYIGLSTLASYFSYTYTMVRSDKWLPWWLPRRDVVEMAGAARPTPRQPLAEIGDVVVVPTGEIVRHGRPGWMSDAACREHPEITWFPASAEEGLKAKSICYGCLVMDTCREYAIEHCESGVWGGMTDGERHRFAGARNRGRPAAHDDPSLAPGRAPAHPRPLPSRTPRTR